MSAITFHGAGDFAACNDAEKFLASAGFSVGRMQRGDPRGILFGDFDIQKWRNLSQFDIAHLHGFMRGDMRNGPVTVTLLDKAPAEAKAAFERARSQA